MNSAAHGQKNPPTITPSTTLRPVALQRQCGCGASAGLMGKCPDCQSHWMAGKLLQTKLHINQPGDAYEQEADRMAEQVMRTTEADHDGGPARPGAPAPIQERAAPGDSVELGAGSAVGRVLNRAGQPLDEATRSFFSARFGHDFAHVRVHADAEAAESARSLNALAYTVGAHVVFGAGRFAPGSRAGGQLLAHELAHVVQQTGRSAAGAPGQAVGLIQRQPEPESKLRDLPIFLEKLELDVGQNLQDYGHHLYQAAALHPDEPDVLKDAFARYALGKNVLTSTFRYAGFKRDAADKLALGTGILFKGLNFVRQGELVLDFQVDIGRGVKFETNINLGVNPNDVTDVRKAGVNFGLVHRF